LIELLREGQAFDAAIAPLMDLGFLRKDPTQQGSSIHFPQMIQNLVRKSLTPEEKAHWARIAIQVVGHAIPEEPNLDPEFETVRARLSPHVYRCIEHAESLQTVELTDVLTNLIGMMLSTVARSHAKLKYLDSLVTQLDDGYYRCQAAKWRAYR
jgi:hypothetical protein